MQFMHVFIDDKTVYWQVTFESDQSSSVIELQLTIRDSSPTSDVVYYVSLTDVLLSNADVIGCPASIGQWCYTYNLTIICYFLAVNFINYCLTTFGYYVILLLLYSFLQLASCMSFRRWQ